MPSQCKILHAALPGNALAHALGCAVCASATNRAARERKYVVGVGPGGAAAVPTLACALLDDPSLQWPSAFQVANSLLRHNGHKLDPADEETDDDTQLERRDEHKSGSVPSD